MDSKYLATQILLKDLLLLRQYEGATWSNYQCTTLLMPLWNCQEKDEYILQLKSAIEHHIGHTEFVDFVYSAFGIDLPCEPSLLGSRRQEIAANYGVSISTVINRENVGLRALARGIVNDNPQLCGITISGLSYVPGPVSSARYLMQAINSKILSIQNTLEKLDILQLGMRNRVGCS